MQYQLSKKKKEKKGGWEIPKALAMSERNFLKNKKEEFFFWGGGEGGTKREIRGIKGNGKF